MSLYNVYINNDGKSECYSVKTACTMQFNVPHREAVIDETDKPITLVGYLDLTKENI